MKELEKVRNAVAQGFINQCIAKFHDAIYIHKNVTVPLAAADIQLAIANNIEGALIQQYGGKLGKENATKMLTYMLDVYQTKKSSDIRLSPMGSKMMDELYKTLVSDFINNGYKLPQKPITH